MVLNHGGGRRIRKVGRSLGLRRIRMVSLILEERLAYLFLIVNAAGVGVELRVVGRVPVRLEILGFPGDPGVDRCRLTRGSM